MLGSTSTRLAEEDDIVAIEIMRRTNSSELGFVPLETYRVAVKRERIIVTKDNEDHCIAFCWFTITTHVINVKQIAVKQGWRRIGIASRMMMHVKDIASHTNRTVELKSREGIDGAKELWESLGFRSVKVEERNETQRRRPLVTYQWP